MKSNKYYNKDSLLKALKEGLKPDEQISVSDFAEKHIYMPENSAYPGLVQLDITPFMKRPLNCLSPGNGIPKIAMVACVQIGKSQMGLIFASAMMKIAPGNTMIVMPRVGDAEDFSTERLTPILKASPELRKLIKLDGKSSDNKVSKKTYKGGFIYFAGAQSAASFRSKPIRYLYMDEIDEYPLNVEGQGSPIILGENRTTSYTYNKKIVLTSTPTDEHSLIWKEYQKGTMEQYHWNCPHCQGSQTFDFKLGMKYKTVEDKNKDLIKDSVYYECMYCKQPIYENQKFGLLLKGEWIAEQPDAEFPSFRLNILYSPFVQWEKIISKYLSALTDKQEMKAFVNTYLGEIWQEEVKLIAWQELFERGQKEKKELELDYRIVCLTAACDVQKDRIAFHIMGWGKNEESWTVFYREFSDGSGNLNADTIWNQIKDLVERPYKHPSGINLYIRYCAMDSGFNTQKVYDFCSKNRVKFKAIKGSTQHSRTLLSAPHKKDIVYKGTVRKDGIELYSIGGDVAKEEIYYRLRIKEDGDKCMHFNSSLDEKFYKMLMAEKQVSRFKNGREYFAFELVSSHARNESIDTTTYNYAIAKGLCHVDLLDDVKYKEMYQEIFGDYGIEIIKSQRSEEEINKEKNQKKIEIIETLAKKKKVNKFSSGKGYMSGYKY